MQVARGACHIICCSFSFFIFILTCHLCASEKLRYASDKECDRHSLDALYHEKYKLITNNIFADTKEFVSRVADLVEDSLTSVLAALPDRDVSDDQEKRVHNQFKNAKSVFTSKVKKMQKNITSSWDDLLSCHFNLLFDNGKSSLKDYLNRTIRMTDSYSEARKMLDSVLSSFIDFIEGTVEDGLRGIRIVSTEAVKKEEKKKNESEAASMDDTNQNQKSKDNSLRDKMVEVAEMIVPGFLKKITVEVIKRNMNLTKESGIKPENRDSVLNDIEFDMLMMKNRIRAIIQTDVPMDKGATDLARRSIYTYWADMADEMYKEKLRAAKTKSADKSNTGRLYYRNLWKDEEQILETLLNLMEVYP